MGLLSHEDFLLCCSVQLPLNFVFDHPAQKHLQLLVHLWHSWIRKFSMRENVKFYKQGIKKWQVWFWWRTLSYLSSKLLCWCILQFNATKLWSWFVAPDSTAHEVANCIESSNSSFCATLRTRWLTHMCFFPPSHHCGLRSVVHLPNCKWSSVPLWHHVSTSVTR